MTVTKTLLIKPGLSFHGLRLVGGLQMIVTLGRLAVPTTLEMNRRTLT